MNGKQRVIIENVAPSVDQGKYPAKRVLNDLVQVSADIFCDSHDMLGAEIHFKHQSGRKWQIARMEDQVNDLWTGAFKVKKLGRYSFSVLAWVDKLKTWHRDIQKKIEANTNYAVDLLIGALLLEKMVAEHGKKMTAEEQEMLTAEIKTLSSKTRKPENRIHTIQSGKLWVMAHKYPVREHAVKADHELVIEVDRQKAAFSSWYEVFPRSLGKGGKHGTFKDLADFLPYVASMGFDVLYLPPIHPIGETNRKGKNNSVTAKKGEPGSPWAIGGDGGGHKAIHKELGTTKSFQELIHKAKEQEIEIAMDIAFQCSPDHPYIKEHPEWFNVRPDGSLQYAENPPKKYEDIYPINFESDDWENLWNELKSIFLYWIDQGIKIFRVDNPHTKSFRFWHWVIAEIRKKHPDTIFLAEAFTRPKIMAHLAKLGFNQSYTYFTWRVGKHELTSYMEELVNSELGEYFRPNFWPNTPDILPFHLQGAGRPAFVQRVILASMLSSNYGVYGPAYELLENKPSMEGKEEYLNSEKYELKNWVTGSKASITSVISRLNKIRKENPALHNMHSLKILPAENDQLLTFSKMSDDGKNIILVVVNLDTEHKQHGMVGLPLSEFGIGYDESFEVHDLLSGSFYRWQGEYNYVELDPGVAPAHIFKIIR